MWITARQQHLYMSIVSVCIALVIAQMGTPPGMCFLL